MWNEEDILTFLKQKLPQRRFNHVMGVRDTAVKLAERYSASKKAAATAALLHDCAKNMENEELLQIVRKGGYEPDFVQVNAPQLLHSVAAIIIAKEKMNIIDEDILNAVRYHTTGRENMSLLEKIIYIADYIEPSRNFPEVEYFREKAFLNLDETLLEALENSIKYVVGKKDLLHPDTVLARNFMLIHIKKDKSEI